MNPGPPVSSFIVAEHIRWLRSRVNVATTPMHAIKLVYIAHGWMLGWKGQPLITEQVQAWKHGPVIPELYHAYKAYGTMPIAFPTDTRERQLDNAQNVLIRHIEEGYRQYSALQLSAATHEPGSPWDITVKKHGLVNAVIPEPLIRDYYARLVSR